MYRISNQSRCLGSLMSSLGKITKMKNATMMNRSSPIVISSGRAMPFSTYSDNITYSGGHESVGQGGFYGSGGARAGSEKPPTLEESRMSMLALAADVQQVATIMEELQTLENLLVHDEERNSNNSNGGGVSTGREVSGRSIEIKSSIKKLMTSGSLIESLNRLEVHGKPVWGLSSDERELIILAREKVNEC